MSNYPEFARGRLSTAQAFKMWSDLTEKLNAVGYGEKSIEKWQKTWTDYKQALKKKATEIEKHRQTTGGGPEITKRLTDFELKILSILGDTFYKGIGVEELGIASREEISLNIHASNSQPFTSTKPSPVLDKPALLPYTFEVESIPGEIQSPPCTVTSILKQSTAYNISEVVPASDTLQSPKIIAEQPKNLVAMSANISTPKYYSPSTNSKDTSTNLSTKRYDIPFRKRPNQVFQDHDYLTNLQSDYKKKKSVKESQEDDLNKVYLDTVDILQNINSNISKSLEKVCDSVNNQNITLRNINDNVENLTKEIKCLTNVLKGSLENNGAL